MKIVVYEFITGGGMREKAIPAALAQEGDLMLRSLTADLLCSHLGGNDRPTLKVTVLRDDRMPWPTFHDRLEIVDVGAGESADRIWQDALLDGEVAWPLAPESDGILEGLCQQAEIAGTPLWTSSVAAVRVTASKGQTAARLREAGLPVVATVSVADAHRLAGFPIVLKPDDGVGCDGARILHDLADLPQTAGWVVQPLVDGEPGSLSAIFHQGAAMLLSVNRQMVERTATGFRLTGCVVNASLDRGEDWQTLLDGIAAAFPELSGYAGVDFVMTQSGPIILEINPRLTTSYCGLTEALGENPMGLIREVFESKALPPPRKLRGKPVTVRLERTGND